MAGGSKAPDLNNSKQTWHHRGVIVKGKESEMGKRQYKYSGYFLFIYFLIFYSCVNWPHLSFSFSPWRENMGHSLITKFPQDLAIQGHLNTLFQKVEGGGTTQKTVRVPRDKQYPFAETCRIRVNWQQNGKQNKCNPTLNTKERACIVKASSSMAASSKRTFPLLFLLWILMVTMEHLQHHEKVTDQEQCILQKVFLDHSFEISSH